MLLSGFAASSPLTISSKNSFPWLGSSKWYFSTIMTASASLKMSPAACSISSSCISTGVAVRCDATECDTYISLTLSSPVCDPPPPPSMTRALPARNNVWDGDDSDDDERSPAMSAFEPDSASRPALSEYEPTDSWREWPPRRLRWLMPDSCRVWPLWEARESDERPRTAPRMGEERPSPGAVRATEGESEAERPWKEASMDERRGATGSSEVKSGLEKRQKKLQNAE